MRLLAVLALALALVACSDSSDPAGAGSPDSGAHVDAAVVATPDAALADPADAAPIALACSLEEVQPIMQCAIDNCVDSLTDQTQLLTCVGLNCGVLLLGLSPDCLTCALAGLSGDLQAIADACASGLPELPAP